MAEGARKPALAQKFEQANIDEQQNSRGLNLAVIHGLSHTCPGESQMGLGFGSSLRNWAIVHSKVRYDLDR